MMKPHQEDQAKPFYTEEVEAELIAADYEFALPCHASDRKHRRAVQLAA